MEYILVQWPQSQMLMDEPWFNECFLADSSNEEQEWVGSAAYFVPKERLEEMK